MKKLFVSFVLMIAFTVSSVAMSGSNARSIALFLTDKMAYELNLTEAQYQSVYEVNYDYFLSLGGSRDLYGSYWNHRNADLYYILGNTKFARMKAMNYFYRPAYWRNQRFNYRIYSRYSNRNKFYFDNPSGSSDYNSGHSWKSNNNRSYFKGRSYSGGNGMRSSMSQGNGNSQKVNGNSRSNRNGNGNGSNSGVRTNRNNGNGNGNGNGNSVRGNGSRHNNNGNGQNVDNGADNDGNSEGER